MMPNSPKQAYCTKFLLRMRTQPPVRTHTAKQVIQFDVFVYIKALTLSGRTSGRTGPQKHNVCVKLWLLTSDWSTSSAETPSHSHDKFPNPHALVITAYGHCSFIFCFSDEWNLTSTWLFLSSFLGTAVQATCSYSPSALKIQGAQGCIFVSNERLFCTQVSLGLLRQVPSAGYLQEADTFEDHF